MSVPRETRFVVTSDVIAEVDTSWTLITWETGTSFFSASILDGGLLVARFTDSGAATVTMCLTEDEAGALPLTNPASSGSTQTLGVAPDGTTSVVSWPLSDVPLPASDQAIYVWLKCDAGTLDDVTVKLSLRM